MAVQMDRPSEISAGNRAQNLYNKNVELENTLRKAAHSRVPLDQNTWQKIRENYEAILLEDHSFSEKYEIELALWQLHYRRIEELRASYNAAFSSNNSIGTQNGKGGPARPDRLPRIRSQFKTFLSEATGFYHELMLKVKAKYGLPLGYSSDDPESQFVMTNDGQKSTDVKKGLISCHRCLIYLGDLARYKGQYGEGGSKARDFAAASGYYMQAFALWPASGNPHHQLAILAAYHGDEFLATYRYFRSLAVESPFTTARDNLIIAFERNRQNYSQMLVDSKTSTVKAANPRMNGKGRGRGETRLLSKDNKGHTSPKKDMGFSISETFKSFCVKFVRVNGVLFTRTSLETFTDVLSMTKDDFMILLSSGEEEKYNFGSDAADCGLFIVRMVAILIFTVHNVGGESKKQSYTDMLQRPVLLQNAYTAVFELMGPVVERCLKLKDPLTSYLVPGILVFVEWLACRPDVAMDNEVGEKQANARLFFWKSCISFLNKFLSSGFMSNDEDESCFFNMAKYEEGETANRVALCEDFELRGFLPLKAAQSVLDFSRAHSFGNESGIKEKKTRVYRMIAAGKAFSNVVRVGQQGIYFDAVIKKFIIADEPPFSADSTVNVVNEPEQGRPVEKTTLGGSMPANSLFEGEDEEEVIVFKPSVADKQAGGGFPAVTSYNDLGLVTDVSGVDLVQTTLVSSSQNGRVADVPCNSLGVHTQSVLSLDKGHLLQGGFVASSRPLTSVSSAAMQHLDSFQPDSSAWLVDQQASMVNGFKSFSIMDNGHMLKHKPSEPLTTGSLLPPLSQTVSINAGNGYSTAQSETFMPLKADYSIPSGTDFGFGAVKSHSALPVGSKKSPVCKPTRHAGPPPGFTPATTKYVDDPQYASTIQDENQLMDDYSWLDGYHPSPAKQCTTGFNVSTNLNGHVSANTGKNGGVTGAMSFPFPGKQSSAFPPMPDIPKLWQDRQFPEHLRFYEQQQQKGNQQPISLPEYQGQAVWGSPFLV